MYQTIELMPGVTLRCVPAERFKQGCLSIQFLRPMCRQEAAMNALIPSVLLRGTVKRPNLRDITLMLDDLYGVSIGELVRRVGDYQTVGLYFGFMEDRFALPGDRILEPLLDFVRELFLEPVVEEGGFSREFVSGEKRNMISAIDAQMNDKRTYVSAKLLEKMCKADSFGIPKMGTREQVEAIDPVTLYRHYCKVLEESPVEAFYVGSADPRLVADKLKALFDQIPRRMIRLPDHTPFHDGGGGDYSQTMEISQGKLAMGFVSPVNVDDSRFFAMQLFNILFGAGMTSKLFINIREKKSLCYYIGSGYYGAKGLLTVGAGIDSDQCEAVKQEVVEQLRLCQQGQISQEELTAAKQVVLSSLKGAYDSPASIESYETIMIIGRTPMSVEQYRRNIETVTLEQVIDVSKTLKLHTTYSLKGVEA